MIAIGREQTVILAARRKEQLSGIYPSMAAGRERRHMEREIRGLADARSRSLVTLPGNRRRAIRCGDTAVDSDEGARSDRSRRLPDATRGSHGDLDWIGVATRTAATPRDSLISVIVAGEEREVLSDLARLAGPGNLGRSAPAAARGIEVLIFSGSLLSGHS